MENSTYNYVVCGFVQVFVCIFGIIGNTISAAVLSRPEMSSSVNVLLMGLALADNTFLLVRFLVNGIVPFLQFYGLSYNYENFYLPFIYPPALVFGSFGLTASTYFTVAITLERFVVIYWPLRARKICSVKTAWRTTAIIVLLSFLYSIPSYFEQEILERLSDDNVTVEYWVNFTDFGASDTYQILYLTWCYPIFNFGIPFVVLTVFNIAIYITIRKAIRLRQGMTESQNTEISIARMLLCVVLVFGICQLPNAFFYLAELMTPGSKEYCFGLLATSVNSSVNFIIYCVMSRKFRLTLIRLCRKIFHRCGLSDEHVRESIYGRSTRNLSRMSETQVSQVV